jgi:hypothetical protein
MPPEAWFPSLPLRKSFAEIAKKKKKRKMTAAVKNWLQSAGSEEAQKGV